MVLIGRQKNLNVFGTVFEVRFIIFPHSIAFTVKINSRNLLLFNDFPERQQQTMASGLPCKRSNVSLTYNVRPEIAARV